MGRKKQLKFIDRILNKVMNGKIKGIELPKKYADFTAEEKEALYFHNPEKTKALFVNPEVMQGKTPKVTKEIQPPTVETAEHDEEE